MKWEKLFSPTYTLLKVELGFGESITTEAGAFVYGRGEYEIKTSTLGIGSAILRKIAGGESFFLNTFIAKSNTELGFAPVLPGDIQEIEVNGEVLLQDSAYFAHTGDIKIGIGWRGIKGIFAEPYSGLFWLKLSGNGIAFVNSFGAIKGIELKENEKIIIDNNHFVAMDAKLKWNTKKFGGFKSFFLGGEGIVFEVTGPGRIWIQTRNIPNFVEILKALIKPSQ